MTRKLCKKYTFFSIFGTLYSDSNQRQNKFFNKTFTKKKNSFFRNMFFLSLIVCSPIDESYRTNLIFSAKTKSSETTFSPNYIFSFVPSVFCTLNDIFVIQRSFSRKSFSEQLLFLKYNFEILLSFLCKPLIIYNKPFKNLINLKVILCLKKEVLKMIFVFCLRFSVPPLIRIPIKKTFHGKDFSRTVFFLNCNFFTAFLSNHFDKIYQTIQNTFFMKTILYHQKKLLGKLFFFFSFGTHYSHWQQCFSNLFLEKNLLYIFSSDFFMSIIMRVYTYWWIIPNTKWIKFF